MKDLDDFENNQVYRNLVQKKIKVAKSNFINDQLKGGFGDSKSLWKILKKIAPMGNLQSPGGDMFASLNFVVAMTY